VGVIKNTYDKSFIPAIVSLRGEFGISRSHHQMGTGGLFSICPAGVPLVKPWCRKGVHRWWEHTFVCPGDYHTPQSSCQMLVKWHRTLGALHLGLDLINSAQTAMNLHHVPFSLKLLRPFQYPNTDKEKAEIHRYNNNVNNMKS